MGSEELWSFMSQVRRNSVRDERSLAAYSPRGGTEWDTPEHLRPSLTCRTSLTRRTLLSISLPAQ